VKREFWKNSRNVFIKIIQYLVLVSPSHKLFLCRPDKISMGNPASPLTATPLFS
jgi:hypothetical protein